MGHYADRETSGGEYGGVACVFDQLAFWGNNVSTYSGGRVIRCTLWVSIHVSRSTGKLSVTTVVRRGGHVCGMSATTWTTLKNNLTLGDYDRADGRGCSVRLIPLPPGFQLDWVQWLPLQRVV